MVDGGRAGAFWPYTWVIVGQFFIVLSLAEMASMAPTAGGQYHWVSEFAPRNAQKILSYTSGWLSSVSWQSFLAADALFAAQLIFSLVSLQYPEFEVQNWHEALTAMLVAILWTAINAFGASKLATIEAMFATLHVVGFFVVLITLAVTGEKQTGHAVFLEFYDGGGYPTMGLTMMAGQVAAMWNVLGADSVAHISEEVNDASSVAPRAMFWTYVLNVPLAVAILLVFLFTLSDPYAATTEAAFPFLYVLSTSSLSVGGQMGITAIMLVLLFMIGVSCFASTARQAFAFARDDGFPGSRWLKRVDAKLGAPVNACLVTCGYSLVMSCVYLGSAVAFNAILSLGLVALMATYGISIGCVLIRRIRDPSSLPLARWSLGRWGVMVNGCGLTFALYSFFWGMWPIYWNPGLSEMNWAVLMFGALMGLAFGSYAVSGRKIYTGPVAKCQS